nr:hypothetical protein [Streptococcus intermedius]
MAKSQAVNFQGNSDFCQQHQIAFEDLKKEILVGHQEIIQGKVTSLKEVRKEFDPS